MISRRGSEGASQAKRAINVICGHPYVSKRLMSKSKKSTELDTVLNFLTKVCFRLHEPMDQLVAVFRSRRFPKEPTVFFTTGNDSFPVFFSIIFLRLINIMFDDPDSLRVRDRKTVRSASRTLSMRCKRKG